ncbi:MAG TPA: hypothetical protein VFS19_03865 [Planctomycetota bacterium]|nr:hypothetical protein [Planctomycetota bacterium]
MRFSRVFVPALLPVLLAACSPDPLHFEGRDTRTFTPDLCLAFDLIPGPVPPDKAGGPSLQARSSLAVELDFASVRGKSSQDVPAGENPEFDGTTFPGPTRLRSELSLIKSTAVMRGGLHLGWNLWLEARLGAGAVYRSMEISSESRKEHDSRWSGGMEIGAGVHWYPLSWGGVFAEFSGCETSGSGTELSTDVSDIGVIVSPRRGVEFTGSWRRWTYLESPTFGSDIEYELKGPMLGLKLVF